jgi:hypothetical protein
MSADLETLGIRVEQLERHLNQLELRLNYDDMRHEILYATRVTALRDDERPGDAPSDPGDQQEGEGRGLKVARLETMMRSMLMHQGNHAADLRKAIGYLQELTHRRLA